VFPELYQQITMSTNAFHFSVWFDNLNIEESAASDLNITDVKKVGS